jgi:hypothetical protein
VIESVRIEPEAAGAKTPTEALRREFPTLEIRVGAERPPTRELRLEASEWAEGDIDFVEFDRLVDALVSEGPTGFAIGGAGTRAENCAIEILTRCQRWIDRRNTESAGALFDRLLVRHQAMHDLSLPLVNADYRHALDTWQWVLRLDAHASLAVQAAALFHDVERLANEPRIRVEHLAPSYDAFKAAHAATGAAWAACVFGDLGIHPAVTRRARILIAAHERTGEDPEVRLINDADALSFFSLNSPAFLDYFGPEHTRRKIRYTFRRLSGANRHHLSRIRMRPDFAALLREETEVEMPQGEPVQIFGDAVA